jgi:hypothetical protein
VHQYIFGHDEAVARFVADLIPECRLRGFGKCRAIGIADAEGKLLGGLVYRNWCPEVGTIEISGAAGKPKEAIDARTTADASDGWHGITSPQPAARPYHVRVNGHRQSATADADAADAAA